MVNFQGSILDSLLANYVKAHSHIFFAFSQATTFLAIERKTKKIYLLNLYFISYCICSSSQQRFCGITECKLLYTKCQRSIGSHILHHSYSRKTFHNIIVKTSKLASLHGVKKKKFVANL